jgi:tRNA pseudouridine55 synthase
MARRRNDRSDPVDGLLLLNKPAGLTSNQALQKVKRLLRASKAGHTGSLDPAATGMLPLCFGEATKVCAFLLDADKTYRVSAKLGVATDTGDATGAEIKSAPVPDLSAGAWNTILQGFLGQSLQVPPMYSALKKGGKRLYELARKGEIVERKPRPIRIDRIELLEFAGTRLIFRVRCSKGTYIRSLVEDIAKVAGTVAHTARLHRESVAEFRSEDMIELRILEAHAADGPARLRDRLLPADMALAGLPEVGLEAALAVRFCGGQAVAAPKAGEGLARVYGEQHEFLGVGEVFQNGKIAPRRVFRTAARQAVDI